jgi:hypothetical protein
MKSPLPLPVPYNYLLNSLDVNCHHQAVVSVIQDIAFSNLKQIAQREVFGQTNEHHGSDFMPFRATGYKVWVLNLFTTV